MNDISNRTLVFLAIIAIFFSLFGTITILSKLGIETPNLITGAAPFQNANVSVTVAATTSITLTSANVSFGNGSAFGGVYLSTASGTDNPSTFNDPTSSNAVDDFTINNDGNVDVNLTLNGSSAANFITTGTAPLYNWSATNFSNLIDNGCYNTSYGAGTALAGYGLNGSQHVFGAGPNVSVCQNLSFRDANDSVNVTIRLFLPTDTEPQIYTDTRIFFMATQV